MKNKKILSLILTFVLLLSFLSGCNLFNAPNSEKPQGQEKPPVITPVPDDGDNSNDDNAGGGANASENSGQDTPSQKHTITLKYYNGQTDDSVLVDDGKTLPTPTEPTKLNYIFDGWYTDGAFTTKYDFSQAVNYGFSLHAHYRIDGVKLTNTITTDTVKGVVKIYNKSYNKNFFGSTTDYSTSQGSGFIFHQSDNIFYVVTNCHVAKLKSGYSYQQFQIVDYQDKTYDAKLYTNSNKLGDAISPEYDLAVLYFTADISSSNVCALPLGVTNPKAGDDVISVTAPNGQQNAISFGKVKDYVNVTLSEKDKTSSNVTFPVIYHDGYINNGSSGGALFDSSLYVVGVNYAGANADINTNYKSYAVPIEKVKEFLNAYVYNT